MKTKQQSKKMARKQQAEEKAEYKKQKNKDKKIKREYREAWASRKQLLEDHGETEESHFANMAKQCAARIPLAIACITIDHKLLHLDEIVCSSKTIEVATWYSLNKLAMMAKKAYDLSRTAHVLLHATLKEDMEIAKGSMVSGTDGSERRIKFQTQATKQIRQMLTKILIVTNDLKEVIREFEHMSCLDKKKEKVHH